MTDRTFSPVAQAVLNAYNAGFIKPVAVHCKPRIAAALRAVVQELKYFGITKKNILAIAAELQAKALPGPALRDPGCDKTSTSIDQ